MTGHTHRSTSPKGLDFDSFPMRLFDKAKRLGVWDPMDLDFSQDREDWKRLNADEREALLNLTAVFLGGEESVTLDLLPLIMTIAQEGRLEEELFLTSFLWEEAKHVEAFRRFLDEVPDEAVDLSRFYSPSYRRLFDHELPEAMNRLRTDQSPVAQAIASVTYNMIVEGTLAETGYHAYLQALERMDIMPGLRQLILHLNRDESRHIAYGLYLLTRLIEDNGDEVWEAIEARMGELLILSARIIFEIFMRYETLPFGLDIGELMTYAISQFQRRYIKLSKARTPAKPKRLARTWRRALRRVRAQKVRSMRRASA